MAERSTILTLMNSDCPANARPADSHQNTAVAATLFGLIGQEGHVFSEDCLTLNIWSKPQKGEKKKAVLVWIHGGGK